MLYEVVEAFAVTVKVRDCSKCACYCPTAPSYL